jgi:hypothetical protein
MGISDSIGGSMMVQWIYVLHLQFKCTWKLMWTPMMVHYTSQQYSVLVQVWQSVNSMLIWQLQHFSHVCWKLYIWLLQAMFFTSAHTHTNRSGESVCAGGQAIVPLLLTWRPKWCRSPSYRRRISVVFMCCYLFMGRETILVY